MKSSWFAGAAALGLILGSPTPSLTTPGPPGGQLGFQERLVIPVVHHHHQQRYRYGGWSPYGSYSSRDLYVPPTRPRRDYQRWYGYGYNHGDWRGRSYWNFDWGSR